MKVVPRILCASHPSADVGLRFNGGNTCWTCNDCNIITGYTREVFPFDTMDDVHLENDERADQGYPGRWQTHDVRQIDGEYMIIVDFNPVAGG